MQGTPRKIQEGLYELESPACPHCGTTHKVNITGKQLWSMNNGLSARDVLPDEDPAVHERFISGTCSPCWNKLWSNSVPDRANHPARRP